MRDPLAPGWGEAIAAPRPRFPRELRNTLSNTAYLVAAAWCATQGPVGWAMTIALVVLAIGSGSWHGTQQAWAQTLDRFGMHMVFAGLAICGVAPATWWAPWLMLAGGALAGYLLCVRSYVSLTGSMAAYLVVAIVSAIVRSNGVALSYSLTAFAIAYGCWHLDHRTERPFGVWGHAVWHIITALAIALLFAAVHR
jgi:MFS family permease